MSKRRRIIVQGEHIVSADPDLSVSTLLGSCVACCLWDPVAKVGGMNHLLIAQEPSADAEMRVNGVESMERIIGELLNAGANLRTLEAKVFGGAKMIEGLSNIGVENSKFVLAYLAQRGINCRSKSLGGMAARHIQFWPVTGLARQKTQTNVLVAEEIAAEGLHQGPKRSSSKMAKVKND
jgi:chemotaxis protein CheD